jgi:hypothetical protein
MIGNNLLLGSGDEGYNLTRSLRFRSSASAYLNRTPATSGSLTTWTWSGWVKRGALGTIQPLFGYLGATQHYIRFLADNTLDIALYDGASYLARLVTTQVFRDPSAYYHIVVIWNTTNATASNRVQLYINGVQVTAFSTATYPAQNTTGNINSNAYSHGIGSYPTYLTNYFDGYLAEVNFIDGQALTPSSFGETDLITGVWKPKGFSGTYGTNGFELQFTDNSAATAAAIGKDSSGNGNNWTPNNISVTAGVTYDSMTDVPTLTSATAANFAVLNPLDTGSNITLSAANLQTSQGASAGISKGTIGVSSGKWYWEVTLLSGTTSVGIANVTSSPTQNYVGQSSTSYGYYSGNGNKYNNASGSSYGASYTTNDVIGVALDLDAGTLVFYKNNSSQGTAFSSLSGTFVPAIGNDQSNTTAFNAGQRPFAYTPPSGYVALNTFNLPTSTIVKGNTVMDATLWTGNGSSQSITNSGAFKPDFVWIKNRNNTRYHILTDSVRGTNSQLFSNDTLAQETRTDRLTAFNSTGFSVGSYSDVNLNADTFVGWQWQAGQGSSSTNTSGTITSTVSVNASAGFSIATYTGTGANATFGHGLGVAPSMVIVKSRSNGSWNWGIWHQSLTGSTPLLRFTTGQLTNSFNVFRPASNTSSVFAIGDEVTSNENGGTYVAYCWTTIAGFSSFGSYTGNGSSDGSFIYTGFKPKFLLIKKIATGGGDRGWLMEDTSRSPYNAAELFLYANSSDAESNSQQIDFLSNGFKIRNNGLVVNDSGVTMIYAAFASNPFRNSLAN